MSKSLTTSNLTNKKQAFENGHDNFFKVVTIAQCVNFLTKHKSYLVILFIGLILFYIQLSDDDKELSETINYLSSPKINDFYFLDFRVLSDNLRPKEKYRLAKVVDITGDVVTLLYSDFYYYQEREIKDSIRFGHLRYQDYFQTKRYDFTVSQLKSMFDANAIFMIKRPYANRLYGNLVNPYKAPSDGRLFIPGKSQNTQGQAYFNAKNIEGRYELAFSYFHESAVLGYDIGQQNLAEMYINGYYVEKDFSKALEWLFKASLQSHKPAILKYVIVCKQVEMCELYDFYQALTQAGVNIQVRNLDVTLGSEQH